MSAPNFSSMNYNLPMICGRPYDEIVREYLENYPDEEDADECDYSWLMGEAYEDAQRIAEDFNKNLTFFKVTVESGYYEGFMFQVDSIDDLDYDEIDNEDAQYYFGKCRSKVKRDSDAELRKIEKWLYKLTERGFVEMVCTARFSNGEAWYQIVTPRAKMKAAAIA